MDGFAPEVVEQVMLIVPHTEVVHHIPGRIRLRITPSGLNIAMRMDVQKVMDSLPGIRGVRINALVGSVVIEYDTGKLPHALWEDMRKLRKHPQLAGQIRERLYGLWKE